MKDNLNTLKSDPPQRQYEYFMSPKNNLGVDKLS